MCGRRGHRHGLLFRLGTAAYNNYQERRAQSSELAYRQHSPEPALLEQRANDEILEKTGVSPPSYEAVVAGYHGYGSTPNSPVNERDVYGDVKDDDESDIDEEGFEDLIANVRSKRSPVTITPPTAMEQPASDGYFGRQRSSRCSSQTSWGQSRYQQKRAAKAARKTEKWAAETRASM